MSAKPAAQKPQQIKIYCQCGRCAHIKSASTYGEELKARGWTKNAKGWRCRHCTEAAVKERG